MWLGVQHGGRDWWGLIHALAASPQGQRLRVWRFLLEAKNSRKVDVLSKVVQICG